MTFVNLFNIFATVVLLPAASAIIGALVKGRIEDSRLFKLRETRNIAGRWTGHLHVPKDSRERIEFYFQKRSFFRPRYWFNPKLVIATVIVGNTVKETIECRGGFCSEDHLIMDYTASQSSVVQFGTMLLRLDSAGTEFDGHWAGVYNGSFAARLTLRKQPLGNGRPNN